MLSWFEIMTRQSSVNLRRFRDSAQLERKQPTIKPLKRLLIVCEGSKTEPNYFKAMRRDLGLGSADVRICGEECGTDPVSVVKFALQEFAEDPGFDEIYCVFDKEGTQERKVKYDQACQIIDGKKLKNGRSIKAIKSVPCFEYWYLLHYKFTTSPFTAEGKKSSGDMVVESLKRELPIYEKSTVDMYEMLKARTGIARDNAVRSLKIAENSGTDNPTTNAHILYDALIALKPVEV